MENPAAAYLESAFEHAPPVKIVRMMYEGALRFIERAARTDDPVAAREWWGRAELVVIELRCCLVHDAAPETSANLESLYLFVEERLTKAALHSDGEAADEAHRVLEILLDGWERAQVQLDSAVESVDQR